MYVCAHISKFQVHPCSSKTSTFTLCSILSFSTNNFAPRTLFIHIIIRWHVKWEFKIFAVANVCVCVRVSSSKGRNENKNKINYLRARCQCMCERYIWSVFFECLWFLRFGAVFSFFSLTPAVWFCYSTNNDDDDVDGIRCNGMRHSSNVVSSMFTLDS